MDDILSPIAVFHCQIAKFTIYHYFISIIYRDRHVAKDRFVKSLLY